MLSKRFVGAAAFTASLAVGGLAGAMFGTPVLSGAQESAPEAQAETPPPEPGHKHREHLATAAEALGMTADELRAELRSGASIADVAAARGVDKQKVIDQLVAAAASRLDRMKAELPNRIAEMVDREGLPRGSAGAGKGAHRHAGGAVANAVDDAATALGIPVQDLRGALANGKSIADVAAERNVAIDAVISAMVADASERIDRAVADGKLTEEDARRRKANLDAKVTAIVNRDGPAGGRHHRGHHGPGRSEVQNSSTTA